MFKSILFLLVFLPATFSFTADPPAAAACNCPSVTNVQKTGEGSGSATFEWSGSPEAVGYKTRYVRKADSFVSDWFYVGGSSYQFTGLSTGLYTFEFAAICNNGESGFVGIDDVIEY
jgi:hypothetical protein